MKVREILLKMKDEGLYSHAARGSHRQFKHPSKPGRVMVPGKQGDDLAPGTVNSIFMGYAIVIEKAANNYSAYVPDLPDCIATGETIEEVEREIREAIEFHLDGMREDGEPIPPPTSQVEYVDIT